MFKGIWSNKVVKNFSYLTIGSIFSQAIGLLTIIKITRKFSPNDYGTFTFLLAQAALLLTFGDLGARGVIIRAIARDKLRTNDLMVNGIKLRVVAIILITLVYIVYNYFFGSFSSLQIILVSLFSLVNCLSGLLEIVFLGNQKMLLPSLNSLVISILWFSTVFSLPPEYMNVNLLFFIYLLLNILKGGIFLLFSKTQNYLIGKVSNFWSSSKLLMKESWPFFLQTLVVLPITYLSNNFLDINSTKAEVGYFNLSQKLTSPILLVLGLALAALFPNLSALWTKDSKRFSRLIKRGFNIFVVGALVLCFLFTLFTKEIVIVLFKNSYLPAIEVCQLQIWYVFMMGINSLIGTIWAATNQEKLILKTAIINALISTPMLFYGSKFGALGLSYGYVISFAIFGIYLLYTFFRVQEIKMRTDKYLWILTVVLFVLSFFILQYASFIYRIVPAFIVIIIAIVFMIKNRRLLIFE